MVEARRIGAIDCPWEIIGGRILHLFIEQGLGVQDVHVPVHVACRCKWVLSSYSVVPSWMMMDQEWACGAVVPGIRVHAGLHQKYTFG